MSAADVTIAALRAEVERLHVWHESAATLMAAYAGRSAEARTALTTVAAERDRWRAKYAQIGFLLGVLDDTDATLPVVDVAHAEMEAAARNLTIALDEARADHEREVRDACIACVEHDRAVARCDLYSGRTEWEVVHPAEPPEVVDRVLAERYVAQKERA